MVQVAVTSMRTAATASDAAKTMNELKRLGLADNTEVCNALLLCHARARQWEQALHAFRRQCERGVPADTDTYSLLIEACVNGAPLYMSPLSACVVYRPLTVPASAWPQAAGLDARAGACSGPCGRGVPGV
jgi:pentatricopeptide repeat protein